MNRFSIFKILSFLLVTLVFTQFYHTSDAMAATHKAKHHTRSYVKRNKAPVMRSVGYSDIVIEADTGRILHSTSPERVLHPASLTKMMTLYITFQALESGKLTLDHRLWVSANAASQSPSKLGLRPGQSIRVEDAILGLVTESANDVAVVLAEAIGGSESQFARLMTRQARALGMNKTAFQNPSGLPDPEQVTCAADMVRLGYALAYHYPQYYHYFGRDTFTYAGITHKNHNHLMERYEGMDGIKTGYIRASGFNLVASAVRGQTRVIATVMGGKSAAARDNQMENLLDNCFQLCTPQGNKSAGLQDGSVSQGDAGNLDAGDYIDLPKKVAAVFAPPTHAVAPAQRYVSAGSSPTNPRVVVQAKAETPTPPQFTEDQSDALIAPPVADEQTSMPATDVGAEDEGVEPEQEAEAAPRAVKASKKVVTAKKKKGQAGKWGIQIGAYTDQAVGQQALANMAKSLSSRLAGSEKVLQRVTINGAPTYRARFLGLDERTARDTCGSLVKQKQNCLVVLPEKQ